MEPLLSIDGLSKRFSDGWGNAERLVLKDLSFSVSAGQLWGVLGGNGSGKTTLLKILSGLLPVFEGSVQVMGQVPSDAVLKNAVGFLPERSGYPGHQTPMSLLTLCARLSGLDARSATQRIERLIERCGLKDEATRKIARLSKGKRQRLALAQALVHNPRVIIADEPVDGLDPLARSRTETLLRELADEGKAVVVATHHLDGSEDLFDQVLVLNRGAALYQGSPEFETGIAAWYLKSLKMREDDV